MAIVGRLCVTSRLGTQVTNQRPSPGAFLVPAGTFENSPPFQRWVECSNGRVPKGRLNLIPTNTVRHIQPGAFLIAPETPLERSSSGDALPVP